MKSKSFQFLAICLLLATAVTSSPSTTARGADRIDKYQPSSQATTWDVEPCQWNHHASDGSVVVERGLNTLAFPPTVRVMTEYASSPAGVLAMTEEYLTNIFKEKTEPAKIYDKAQERILTAAAQKSANFDQVFSQSQNSVKALGREYVEYLNDVLVRYAEHQLDIKNYPSASLLLETLSKSLNPASRFWIICKEDLAEIAWRQGHKAESKQICNASNKAIGHALYRIP